MAVDDSVRPVALRDVSKLPRLLRYIAEVRCAHGGLVASLSCRAVRLCFYSSPFAQHVGRAAFPLKRSNIALSRCLVKTLNLTLGFPLKSVIWLLWFLETGCGACEAQLCFCHFWLCPASGGKVKDVILYFVKYITLSHIATSVFCVSLLSPPLTPCSRPGTAHGQCPNR